MIIVKKGNKEITVPEMQKTSYLAMGYSVLNENGEIVETGKATNLKDLKMENETLKAELIKVKDENKKLKSKNTKLEKEVNELKKEEK